MSQIPQNLRFTATHEWVRQEDDGSLTIGITEHAQDLLGDIVFVELPEMGRIIKNGVEAGVVESVKAAADIYCPVDGEVIAINMALSNAPELINSDPYGEGWIYQIKPTNKDDINHLLDAPAYQLQLDSEKH